MSKFYRNLRSVVVEKSITPMPPNTARAKQEGATCLRRCIHSGWFGRFLGHCFDACFAATILPCRICRVKVQQAAHRCSSHGSCLANGVHGVFRAPTRPESPPHLWAWLAPAAALRAPAPRGANFRSRTTASASRRRSPAADATSASPLALPKEMPGTLSMRS